MPYHRTVPCRAVVQFSRSVQRFQEPLPPGPEAFLPWAGCLCGSHSSGGGIDGKGAKSGSDRPLLESWGPLLSTGRTPGLSSRRVRQRSSARTHRTGLCGAAPYCTMQTLYIIINRCASCARRARHVPNIAAADTVDRGCVASSQQRRRATLGARRPFGPLHAAKSTQNRPGAGPVTYCKSPRARRAVLSGTPCRTPCRCRAGSGLHALLAPKACARCCCCCCCCCAAASGQVLLGRCAGGLARPVRGVGRRTCLARPGPMPGHSGERHRPRTTGDALRRADDDAGLRLRHHRRGWNHVGPPSSARRGRCSCVLRVGQQSAAAADWPALAAVRTPWARRGGGLPGGTRLERGAWRVTT